MPQLAEKSGQFTYADYSGWPEDERWELIDGEAFAMCPAPTRMHQEFITELIAQIHPRLAGSPCRVYAAPFDVRLPKADEADEFVDTVVQPDLAVFCDRRRLDAKGARGAPDWAIEILSPSTAVNDQIRKRALYERHGVREYWLIHPADRLLTIYRLGGQGRYGAPEILELTGSTDVSILPGVRIDWPAPDAFDLSFDP
jgi:Uma2 family endonuclease